METLAILDRKDPMGKLVIQVTWVNLDKGDLKGHQESRVKTEKQGKLEIQERWDSLDHRELEDFQGHLGLRD